jgi:hypothetical protein
MEAEQSICSTYVWARAYLYQSQRKAYLCLDMYYGYLICVYMRIKYTMTRNMRKIACWTTANHSNRLCGSRVCLEWIKTSRKVLRLPSLSTSAIQPPENVERPVGRRREAHGAARGGRGAGGGEGGPGIVARAEAVQVVPGACGGRKRHMHAHTEDAIAEDMVCKTSISLQELDNQNVYEGETSPNSKMIAWIKNN